MEKKNWLKIEFPALAENVALARVTVAALAAQLDFTLADIDEIKVAVSEAVSNAIIHGYDNDGRQLVVLETTLYDQGIEIRVIDRGKGIADLARAMEPAYSSMPERMGLGFTFMNSFMDNLLVETAVGQGTTVIMFKKLTGGAEDQPAS
ncbi:MULTISPECIES: anti-sigma F factor [Carboxydocella]|uniref:Anti-sigma F factor n=2 Tax=Carboxydocella TaxID=178898 RepID=A0A1T4MSV6_9FIRM|nr:MULTISPECIES: anti-sigma F factor [Carboxydocella]AVX20342.1 stage II sporulation protein AB (anti-sigma F factor) [Carboxydocella thermautotrophica]AVX30766.1 stage II sporulation protein AB (anti-sigma F factor) [Carboxydocella thermautotrophica]SJZ70063.1 stage II sporulation protein AB (anti-sigma F factor) [Carboxydocella sporoproducens DSM 16521]GAW30087.1 anti-sigma F factor [Carboxydocella sp. ULO1]GAW31172.1 anti-sigma F factor [Carboxydocella sp. JDF658]